MLPRADPGFGNAGFLIPLSGLWIEFAPGWVAGLFLKRKLSLPVSRMWWWRVSGASSAVIILASPNIAAHSLKLRLVVMITLVCS
jgi:hypothetical protein